MKNYKHHLAIRWQKITLCGKQVTGLNVRSFWADAVKVVKSNPDYKNVKFCGHCIKIYKSKKIKQLTAEECRKA